MDMKKVLVADASVEFCDALAEALKNTLTLRVCHDGLEAETMIRTFAPDVLVMDLALQNLDGIALLQRISDMPQRPRILLTTRFISPYIENAIGGLGVDLLVVKPCHIGAMADRILDLLETEAEPVQPAHRSVSAAAIMIELGIPPRRRGFTYLEQCIRLYQQNPGRTLSNVVYPQVAAACHTGVDGVERAMRQLIHAAWVVRNDKVWRRYFGSGRDGVVPRPTNAEFISRLAEHEKMAARERA